MKTVKMILASFLAVGMAACGGGGSLSGGSSGNGTPTITSVTPMCTPASVVSGGTSTCTASVKGTGNYSALVSWAASAGTINATTGAYTAPASAATVTITATSTEDTTKSGTTTITVTAPSIAVTISPTSVSVPSAGTEQFTATVTGTQTTGVTWSTTAGTISASGLLSLVGVASGTNVTVTATSVADTTKSASAQVSVTQRVIALSMPVQTEIIGFPAAFGVGSVDSFNVSISGAEVGDVVTFSSLGKTSTATVDSTIVSQGYFNLTFNFSTAYDMPYYAEVTVASADGTIQSNQLWIAVVNDQNVLALSKDGSSVYFIPGVAFPVEQYSATTGASQGVYNPNASGPTNSLYSISVDNQTGFPVVDYGRQWILNFGLDEAITQNGNFLMAISALNGYGYVLQPEAGEIGQFNASQASSPITSVSAEVLPWAIDATSINGQDGIVVFSKGDTALQLFNNQLAKEDTIPLSGITTAPIIQQRVQTDAGWMVQAFGSGPAANLGALLAVYDQSLVFWSVDTTNTLHVDHQVTLTGNPILIAKDETHGAVIVAFANLANGTITMQSINMKTYQATNLTSPSTLPTGFMAGGILVSPDGTKIYVGGTLNGQPAFYILQNQ